MFSRVYGVPWIPQKNKNGGGGGGVKLTDSAYNDKI